MTVEPVNETQTSQSGQLMQTFQNFFKLPTKINLSRLDRKLGNQYNISWPQRKNNYIWMVIVFWGWPVFFRVSSASLHSTMDFPFLADLIVRSISQD